MKKINLLNKNKSSLDILFGKKDSYVYTKNDFKIISHLIHNVSDDEEDFKTKKLYLRSDLNLNDDEMKKDNIIKMMLSIMTKSFTLKNNVVVNLMCSMKYNDDEECIEYRYDKSLKDFFLDLREELKTKQNTLNIDSQNFIN